MSKKNGDGTSGALDVISTDWVTSKVRKPTTRREFLKIAGIGGLLKVDEK